MADRGYGRKSIAENGAFGKDMVGEAVCVNELLVDMPVDVVQEQVVR